MSRRIVAGIVVSFLLMGSLALAFSIQSVKASGTIYIRADGSIEPSDALVSSFDNVTYTLTGNITSDGDGIVVEGDNIVLNGAGYTVTGSGSGNGITVRDRSNVTARNMTIRNFDYGIYLYSSSASVLSGNNVTANIMAGIGLDFSSPNNMISGNNITANNYYGIILGSSSDNSIVGNNIAKSDEGIRLAGSCDNNVISGNNITANNYYGIWLYSSSDNSIAENNITENNQNGIFLDSASNNSIAENNITGNSYAGFYISSSSDNSIVGNNIANNGFGISLYYSSNNSVSENNIKDGGKGILLDGSFNNTIHHNNFINNTNQAQTAYSGDINTWDDGYPSGGNYWSDYVGNDTYRGPYQNETGRDGIGDTPYLIDENNRDRYPMMPEHELVVSITVPIYLQLGNSLSLGAIVTNNGFNDEANVNLSLLINGTAADSTTIPLLQADNSYTLSHLWTPTVEGTYNVTAYVHPVPGEVSAENNQKTAFVAVVVSVPFGMQVGVETGDWVKIDYSVSGAPSGTLLPQWLKVEFLSVEGTNATVRVTMHMSDGTEQNATMPVDVVTGGQAFGLSGFVIPANATTGDSVYMSGYGNVTIAGEKTNSYAGASRTVVYLSFSQYGTQLTYYWDKLTGVLVEADVASGGMTATAKTTETNMWQAGPSGLPIEPIYLYIIAATAIIIVAGAAAFTIRRKKKPPEVENSQSELRLSRTDLKSVLSLGYRVHEASGEW